MPVCLGHSSGHPSTSARGATAANPHTFFFDLLCSKKNKHDAKMALYLMRKLYALRQGVYTINNKILEFA
jgi:hypothetical protein